MTPTATLMALAQPPAAHLAPVVGHGAHVRARGVGPRAVPRRPRVPRERLGQERGAARAVEPQLSAREGFPAHVRLRHGPLVPTTPYIFVFPRYMCGANRIGALPIHKTDGGVCDVMKAVCGRVRVSTCYWRNSSLGQYQCWRWPIG